MHNPCVRYARTLRLVSAVVVPAFFHTHVFGAETPAAPAPSQPAATEDIVTLNAFEVHADKDNSYGALESNSLAAFRMELAKAPATAEVFTSAFMDDIGAVSLEDVLTGYAGTVTASSNNPNAGLDAPGDRDGSQGLSIRGVSAGEIKRDGFAGVPNNARTASGQTDSFAIERVDVISGPQSLLYGSVSGGGVINSITKRAQFNTRRTSLKLAFDNYGSKRATFDYMDGRDKFAFRLALVAAENHTNRFRLGGELYGLYAQVAFRVLPGTTIRFSTEKTDYDAIVGFKPGNLNNFLATTDPRRNKDSRYLALTNQVSDIKIYGEPLTYGNLESADSWFSSESIATRWNQVTVESKLPFGLSAQLVGIYTDTIDDRVTDGRSLLPGRGSTLPDGVTPNPNFGANPFDVTAAAIGAPVQINEQRDRNKGVRLSFVHETNFNFFRMKGRSQTAFGGQGFHRGPTFGSSGIAQIYYRSDADFKVLYTNAAGFTTTTPDFTRADYGRTPLQNVYFPVQNGIPKEPLFKPGAAHITYNGQNYTLDPRIYSDPARATAANPFGLIPNLNPAANTYTGNWNRGGETHSANLYFANFTDWMDGRLTTLMGYSVTRFETINVGAGLGNITVTPKASHPGYQFGVNGRVLNWLRAYAVIGTAEQAEASTSDILGVPLKNPQAKNMAPEIGLKATLLDGRFSAQLSYNPTTKTLNENKDAGTAFKDAINPDGINGRVGGTNANQRVNIDRTLTSQEFILSAAPTRSWTVRVKATHLDGNISNDVSYAQNYNDQFYLTNGTVTYKDGTPLMVNSGGSLLPTAVKDVALTLAMINTTTNPYYANPDPTSGRIQSTTLRTVLMAIDPVKGAAATGVTGLPITSAQYTFTSAYPGGVVPIYVSGEKNVGFNEYTFNFQNKYKFASGFAKGFSIFTDLQTYAKNRAYYTNYPDATGSTLATKVIRVLYGYPNATVVNLGLGYSHRGLPWLGDKVNWSTQVNVRNALNHYKVWVVPTSALATTLNARLSTLPRSYTWTTSIDF